jgi:hypothetical protein
MDLLFAFFYSVSEDRIIDDFSFNQDGDYDGEEIQYWRNCRKPHHLHGWMEDLYNKKGGNEVFNCVYLRLTEQDLDQLEHDIKNRLLPDTFFCPAHLDTESDNEDLELIANARAVIGSGHAVYYYSWW